MENQTIHSRLESTAPLNPLGRSLNGPQFQVFGAGSRRKLLYVDGCLTELSGGGVLHRWNVRDEEFSTDPLAVKLQTVTGQAVQLEENERGIWLTQHGVTQPLEEHVLSLPRFEGHPHAALLRVLLHEILVNLVDGVPLPNLLVYDRPWYRDAAMVCMVLERSGHLDLVRDWILRLREPYDRNNAGHREPDNLGQLLYMISLVSDATHPLVATVLEAARACTVDRHLFGLSDFAEHPVYQTKWLKFGLARLGLPDAYKIPAVPDSYSALFWMDYRESHVPTPTMFSPLDSERYPYLTWAEAHFHRAPPPLHLAGNGIPLTWETEASEAHYAGMRVVSDGYAAQRHAAPHTWHAAEMFLYLWEETGNIEGSRNS